VLKPRPSLLATQYGILLYGHGWRKPTTEAPRYSLAQSESGSRSADPVRNGRGRLSKLPRSLGGRTLPRAARRARSSRQRAALNVIAQAALIAESFGAPAVQRCVRHARPEHDPDEELRQSFASGERCTISSLNCGLAKVVLNSLGCSKA